MLDILQVNDGFPFSIALSCKPDSENTESEQTIVFSKGSPVPSAKTVTFYRSNTFAVDVVSVDADDLQMAKKISSYTVSNIANFRQYSNLMLFVVLNWFNSC